jgi:lysophospholipase L1-like esterase
MKRLLFFSIFLAACSLTMNAQKSWAQHERYAASNDTVKARMRMPEYGYNKLAKSRRVEAVLIGNSITDNWAKFDPEFFAANNFVGRGISGQVTAQMLSRFQADVVELNPKMVIIMAGTNDIAMNNGYISHEHILQNIQSMVELAKYHKIKPVLCSCLPAASFKWRPALTPAEDIKRLNEMIKAYAKANKILYVDYYSAFVDEQGGLPTKYAKDGVHPNLEAYKIMEQILLRYL